MPSRDYGRKIVRSLQFAIKITSIIVVAALRVVWGILRHIIWPYDVNSSRLSGRPAPPDEEEYATSDKIYHSVWRAMHIKRGLQQARQIPQTEPRPSFTYETRESGGMILRKYQPVLGLQATYSRMSTVRPLRVIPKDYGRIIVRSLQFAIKITSIIVVAALRVVWGILRYIIWPYDVNSSRLSITSIIVAALRVVWGILRYIIWPYDVNSSRLSGRPAPPDEEEYATSDKIYHSVWRAMHIKRGLQQARQIPQTEPRPSFTYETRESGGMILRKYRPVLGLQPT